MRPLLARDETEKPMKAMEAPVRWWPEELGEQPHSAGGQNEMRYAFFGDQHSKRLEPRSLPISLTIGFDRASARAKRSQSAGKKAVG
jgi:hypothetical protein